MRWILALALLALVAAAGLLWQGRSGAGRASRPAPEPAPTTSTGPAPAPPLASVAERVRRLQHAPEVQELLARFVTDCIARGDEAVPELAALLRDEPDVVLSPRWTFTEGRVEGFPSLRAACIAALLGIPGARSRDALLATLELTGSVDEAYQIAAGLAARGEGGWTEAALAQAAKAADAPAQRRQEELLDLTARVDPAATAAQVVARAPHGEDATDPLVLSRGLRVLPLPDALQAARQVLADPAVTRKAKARYLRALSDRGDPEAFTDVREQMRTGDWDMEMRLQAAYDATGSPAFQADRRGAELAQAQGDPAQAQALLTRYSRRLEQVELLVTEALAGLPENDPRRLSLQRKLDRLRE